ncbi:MAG: hypothetical protein K0S78_1369 [Thermomicrobiales bacterium]|nr:hypothetical protein [Thermomicrobiales bacterium]
MPGLGLKDRIVRAWKDRPRRRQMVVTDITRMEGDRVCVGGYLEDGTAVRPVAGRAGPNERWLRSARGAPVAPFSVVELQVNRAPKRTSAPHTEDRTIPVNGHRVLRTLSDEERQALLERSLSPAVRAIFDAEIHVDANGQWGRFVLVGDGQRSLGTIRPNAIRVVRYQHYPERGRWDYRLRFVDASGEEFQLAVVDLDFRRRLDALREGGLAPDRSATTTLAALQRQTVYLRIGLARGWERHPDRCYLQITGVYGFDNGCQGSRVSG